MNIFLFFITGIVAWRLHTSLSHLASVPKKIPWVGRTGNWASYFLSQIKAIWKTPATIREAYQKYSKHGAIVAIPLPFSRPEIMLPRSLIRWMISQDENVLSPTPVQYEVVGPKYAFWNSSVHGDMAVYKVLKKSMSRELPKMIPIIMDELVTRIDEAFGLGNEWREIPSHEVVRKVIGRVASRVILGYPLCDDEQLCEDMTNFTTFIVPSALLLRLFPPFTHPILSYLTHYLNRIYKQKSLTVLGPYIQQQLDIAEKEMASGAKTLLARDDIMTWLITDAVRRNEPKEGLIDRIACRVFIAQFAAMETTTMTISHCLLDLCASDAPAQIWEGLAEEGRRVLSAPLDLASVNSLSRADSALKETLRLRTSIKALASQVTAPKGLVLEGYDVRLPQGSRLAVSAWGIHTDKSIYGPNAEEYDPFRFSRPSEDNNAAATASTGTGDANADSSAADTNANSKMSLMVSATEDYLPFGMGRHACPGRYFAAVELKLFLAYLAVHYDLKLGEAGRPGFVSIGHFPIPPLKGKLIVRRRSALLTETKVPICISA
ncbi:cytochrome P450 [Podospora didyma]|uniref:Cytochrome P450 n=1 Tax=Podospora didyma TaxID=330526 RepID=A0AAE0NP39_9PEZI|nr:cytochrome P450 [Podospora didyma]